MNMKKKTPSDKKTNDNSLPDDQKSAQDEEHIKRSKNPQELETYIRNIVATVRASLEESLINLTPWFFKSMPQIYYQTVPRADKVRHLSSIITGHIFETRQTVELWNRTRTEVNYIGPGGEKNALIDLAKRLVAIKAKTGALYYSHDQMIFISHFFTNPYEKADLNNKHIADKIHRAKKILVKEYPQLNHDIERYLSSLDHQFVMYGTAGRLRNTFRMFHQMRNIEGVHTFFEPKSHTPSVARLTIGMKEVKAQEVLEDILHLIYRYGFSVKRFFLIHFEEGIEDAITVVNFNLVSQDGKAIDVQSGNVKKMIKALRTLAWVDTDEYSHLVQEPYFYSVNAANFVRSVAAWVHILLSKENPHYFSEHRILMTFRQCQDIVALLVDLFRVKFDPRCEQERKNEQHTRIREQFVESIEKLINPVEKKIFQESLRLLDHILLTNYHFKTKTGLAFRISPDVLHSSYYPQKPFAIYFIIGRDYRFFQVRWKDVARGGLRIVMPRNPPEYSFALAGLFDEVYGLSHAQQLKNKDIPEGGSKAVMILKLNSNRDRAAKGAVNALLDLLVRQEETQETHFVPNMVSYYDKEEIIYLGPDENVTNDLIIWITEQAKRRGYKYSKAFMSSKPQAGINHKVYGVTSEGLNVYVSQVLNFLHIDPKQRSFTIKMTGGPDGDVAGNELKILHREFGENARIVAIADGNGAAYDPAGLNWQELLRLVDSEKSIADFQPKKLSESLDAFVIKADNSENIRKRNELHFRAPADIFIPAGGRPYAVNDQNWNLFITPDNTPTCRAIVEGANIFFTNEAREKLQEAGIVIVKDSTANKCGVICSSYEVIESLILEEDEFMAIKPVYVKQVIDILRDKAGREAKLLFREYALSAGKKNLVTLSKEISHEINHLTDLLLEEFTDKASTIVKDPLFLKLIYKHCPPILVEKYHKRIVNHLPLTYMVAILSAQIASYIVYNEGLNWMESMEDSSIVNAACTYMRNVEDTEKLIEALAKTNIKERHEIATILRHSAARVLTMISLEKGET